MIANIIWKTRNTYTGMPVVPQMSPRKFVSVPRYCVKLPMTLLRPELPLEPNDKVKP